MRRAKASYISGEASFATAKARFKSLGIDLKRSPANFVCKHRMPVGNQAIQDHPAGVVQYSSSRQAYKRLTMTTYTSPHESNSIEGKRSLLHLRDCIAENFTHEDWQEVAILGNCEAIINGHSRLLRSLSFGDSDYAGNVLQVLSIIYDRTPTGIEVIKELLRRKYPVEDPINISSDPSNRRDTIIFQPNVFEVPVELPDPNLLTVMMPFSAEFNLVFEAIKETAETHFLKCQRASDIWENSTIIQDIFSLIYRSYIVICDFTGKNANVFYEAGIAHTLGKHVIPITQNGGDIPFDLAHHRYLAYLNNGQGLSRLKEGLANRFWALNRPF